MRIYPIWFGSLFFFCGPLPPLHAGMTSYGLSEIYKIRVQEISFFSVLFLLSILGVRWLWNLIARDFDRLPRMKFRHAAAFCILFGMATLLILTMISGIREVLTPDAWRRQGNAYLLNSPTLMEERRWSIQQLHQALQDYRKDHEGAYPPHDFVPEIPPKLWTTPGARHLRYHYLPVTDTNGPVRPVVWEPDRFGDPRFVITSEDRIVEMSVRELKGLGIEK